MMLEDAPTPEDRVLDVSGIKVYVDGQSVDLLKGSQIDYVDTLMGAGFTVNNPNAVAACGCGSSFRTADDGGAPGAARTDRPRGREDAPGRTSIESRRATGGFVVSGTSLTHGATIGHGEPDAGARAVGARDGACRGATTFGPPPPVMP